MKTKTFELCNAKKEYGADLALFSSESTIRSNMNEGFPKSTEQWEETLKSYAALPEERGVFRVIVVDERAVGTIGLLLGEHERRKTATISYWLAPQHWRAGVSTAAVKLLCEYMFKNSEARRIEATPFAYNLGSRRVLEKAGFVLEGVMKNSVFKNGDLYDSCMYAMLKNP